MAFLCPVRIGRSKKKKSIGGEIDKDLSRSNSGLGLNHGLGRITGSASIETLVRVGIEKEHGLSPDSKMVVLHDFTPCVDDELEVKRGQIVNILYRENDWVYVIGQDTRQEGFIPYSYCTPYNTQLADLAIKKKLPRDQSLGPQIHNIPIVNCSTNDTNDNNNNSNDDTANDQNGVNNVDNSKFLSSDSNNVNNGNNTSNGGTNKGNNNPTMATELLDISTAEILDDSTMSGLIGLQNSMLKHSQASLSSEQDFLPFAKDICGRYIVLYTFIARDENDVSVERGEFVTVLNREDPEWFWIVRSDGQEGFIPSGFVYPADNILQSNGKQTTNQNGYNTLTNQPNDTRQSQHPIPDVNNETNACQNHNLPIGTAIGHVTIQNNNVINEQNILNSNNTNSQVQTAQQQQQTIVGGSEDLRYHGTELVMLYDYKAQAPDDLSVRRGDWIYADLNNQTVDGWLWAYAPKTRKYGFIPKAYARTPAMTSL